MISIITCKTVRRINQVMAGSQKVCFLSICNDNPQTQINFKRAEHQKIANKYLLTGSIEFYHSFCRSCESNSKPVIACEVCRNSFFAKKCLDTEKIEKKRYIIDPFSKPNMYISMYKVSMYISIKYNKQSSKILLKSKSFLFNSKHSSVEKKTIK